MLTCGTACCVASAMVLSMSGAFASLAPVSEGSAADGLKHCADILLSSGQAPSSCREPLLAALFWNAIPDYDYNVTTDCHFWGGLSMRDRSVEGSRALGFNRLAEHRLSQAFEPPLRRNGSALYVGAHRGAEDGRLFHERFGLFLHLFEPSPSFFGSLRAALEGVPGFMLHNYGLGASTSTARLQLSGTGSRTLAGALGPIEGTEEVLIRAVAEAVPEALSTSGSTDGNVELLHVNCEGCEYDVVDSLRHIGLLARIKHVQLATHLLDPPAASSTFHDAVDLSLQVSISRYCAMHRALSQTHSRSWGLPWVWERWTRRGS